MPDMDDDTKSIMSAIIAESENPMATLMANLAAGVPGGLSAMSKRVRSNSSSSNRSNESDDMPEILRLIAAQTSDTSQSESGPSTPNKDSSEKGKEVDEEESKPKVDEVVERVKRGKLDEHERDLVGCIVDINEVPTTFESVHLPDDIVDTIRSMVSMPLLYPGEFTSGLLKEYSMSGALLFGPPGTGKTLFARALAKESGARMISIKPSDILHRYVGESERLVRSLFKLARRLTPCVVFIDEIDALFGARTHAGEQSSARWHTSMLTEFMQEMDGLLSSQVIVIGATNRPFDLDDAVLRRLPCRVLIDMPQQESRQEILKILLKDEALAEDVDLAGLAVKTGRYSGSDLKNLCLAAAFNAVKENAVLPWKTSVRKPDTGNGKAPESPSSRPSVPSDSSSATKPVTPTPRVIAQRHFDRALSEIPPSTSDTQTSLTEIRNWNLKFGSGAPKTSGGVGTGYGTHATVPGYNPSGSGMGYHPGSTGMGAAGYGSSSAGMGVPSYGASSSGMGVPIYGSGSTGNGVPGYNPPRTGTGIPGYDSIAGRTTVPGYNGGGVGSGTHGLSSYNVAGTSGVGGGVIDHSSRIGDYGAGREKYGFGGGKANGIGAGLDIGEGFGGLGGLGGMGGFGSMSGIGGMGGIGGGLGGLGKVGGNRDSPLTGTITEVLPDERDRGDTAEA